MYQIFFFKIKTQFVLAKQRTMNHKGVTIASQSRYVRYYGQLVQRREQDAKALFADDNDNNNDADDADADDVDVDNAVAATNDNDACTELRQSISPRTTLSSLNVLIVLCCNYQHFGFNLVVTHAHTHRHRCERKWKRRGQCGV